MFICISVRISMGFWSFGKFGNSAFAFMVILILVHIIIYYDLAIQALIITIFLLPAISLCWTNQGFNIKKKKKRKKKKKGRHG